MMRPKMPQIVGSAVCGALLPTIGTVTGGFSLLLVHRLLDLPLVVPCHSPDGLDAACVRKPPLVCEVSPAVCPPSALIWANHYCPSSWSRAGGSSPPPSGLSASNARPHSPSRAPELMVKHTGPIITVILIIIVFLFLYGFGFFQAG